MIFIKYFHTVRMEAHIQLNGSFTQKGNYLWGGALTLAWKQLSQDIIKQQIKLKTKDQQLLKIAQNFNKSPFGFNMLTDSCYYARAGFGNETVHKINEQVSKKFPAKTTAKLEANLYPDSIISYAYFLKLMKFNSPFKRCQVEFNKKMVQGFQAKDSNQKKQILVHNYVSNNNFIIELVTKAQNDHIIIIKSAQKQTPQQVLEKVNKLTSEGKPIGKSDTFKMPTISLSRKRELNQLVGIYLQNEKFKEYSFTKIFEIIKLDIDETGVKVENEGVIVMTRCAVMRQEQPRRFELDQPFWIVMREKLNHPYFVAYIANVDDKDN